MSSDEADFKKGSIGVKAAIGGHLVAILGGGLVDIGLSREAAKMSQDQITTEQKRVYMLTRDQAVQTWRKYAADPKEYELQQEALLQLAWLEESMRQHAAWKMGVCVCVGGGVGRR